jgi:transposase
MPWKECKPMDERLRFVARLLDGEKMAPLCREFGISRVTGHKLFNRFRECGLEAFKDRSRRPYRHANKLPWQVERTILALKKEHPGWGAPKIRDKIIRAFPMIHAPVTVPLDLSMRVCGRLSISGSFSGEHRRWFSAD